MGSLPGLGVNVNNIVGIVPTSDNAGYWMVGSDGGVFGFGDAGFVGSLPGMGVHVNNIVGFASAATGEPSTSPGGGSGPPGGSGPSWSAPVSFDNTGGTSDVSCPSSSFCAVADISRSVVNSEDVSDLVTWNGSAWSQPVSMVGVRVNGVSCVSFSSCLAVGAYSNQSGSGAAFAPIQRGILESPGRVSL